jgi:hypothetical protein
LNKEKHSPKKGKKASTGFHIPQTTTYLQLNMIPNNHQDYDLNAVGPRSQARIYPFFPFF